VSSDSVRDHNERLRRGEVERRPGYLPAHYPSCFGCGPDSPWGLHVEVQLVDGEIHATHTFVDEHAGAPGIAHGGMVAALVDDVCGFILFIIREPAVTRKLEVEYLRPVLIGVPYTMVARVDRHEGRKVFVSCEGHDPDGVLTFRGNAFFLVVDLSHFDQAARDRAAHNPGADPPVAL
jgi:acyl-coenzyme A thioesterase PaaI-like protein